MVKNVIRPELLTFGSLLKDKLFEIPKFQRPYSWKQKQREDLFLDIDYLLDNSKQNHFMATIVCLDMNKKKIDGTNELDRMQIIDGQQRLTTLIILLKAIQIELEKSKIKKENNEANNLQRTIVRGKKLVLLQTNHQSAQMFREYLISSTIPNPNDQNTIAEKEVALAIKECQEYVQNKKQDNKLLDLLKTLKNRLQFIFYILNDEKVVYTVFEVLNSRGLPVASLDKCKSMLMGIVYDNYKKSSERREVINALHEIWGSIYSSIGISKISDSELLRFAATLSYFNDSSIGKTLSESDALDFFEEISKPLKRPANIPIAFQNGKEDICVLISKMIKQVAEKLVAFEGDIRKNNAVTSIIQARLLYVSIGMSTYSLDEKEKLNALWEKITFRIYGLYKKDSRNCVGDYVRLARDIFYGLSFLEAQERLEKIGEGYPIENVMTELKGKPWYKEEYKDELKYVLYRYEEYLAKSNNIEVSPETWNQIWSDSPAKTIEHICPKTFSPNLQKNWPKLSVKSQDELDSFVHNIGNLTLLPPGINSSLGQKSFEDKKNAYKIYSLRITDNVVIKKDWTKNSIKKREEAILDFIKKEWA